MDYLNVEARKGTGKRSSKGMKRAVWYGNDQEENIEKQCIKMKNYNPPIC